MASCWVLLGDDVTQMRPNVFRSLRDERRTLLFLCGTASCCGGGWCPRPVCAIAFLIGACYTDPSFLQLTGELKEAVEISLSTA
jgi:hypothetical protein